MSTIFHTNFYFFTFFGTLVKRRKTPRHEKNQLPDQGNYNNLKAPSPVILILLIHQLRQLLQVALQVETVLS